MPKGRYLYFIISLLIATLSSLSVWIIDSPIKFPFFVIEIVTILYISLVVTGWDFRFPSIQSAFKISFIPIIPELILLAFSGLLTLLNIYDQSSHGTIFQLGMSIASSTILVGLCIFNIFIRGQSFTNLERILISFAIGIVFSSILSLLVLPLNLSSKPIAISIIFGGIAISSLIIRTTKGKVGQKGSNNNRSVLGNVDLLGLILCEIFFVTMVFGIYPDVAFMIGTDINRHYGNTLVLITSPGLFNSFQYTFFNLFQGIILSLSGLNQDIGLFQTSLIMLNGLIPLSVYAMTRRYLSNFDVRIPILATILYIMFSNLSFLYFIEQKIGENHATEFAAILAAGEKTFSATTNFLQPIAFLTPQSISIIFFMISLMMLKLSLSRIRFIPILVLLIVGMYLIHVSEAIIFIILVCASSFIFSDRHLRLTNALLASLIGIILAGGFLVFVQYGWRSEIPFSKLLPFSSHAIIGTLIVVIVTLAWKLYLSSKKEVIKKRLNFSFLHIVSKKDSLRVIISLILILYIVGLFTWQYAEDFRISPFYDTGIAPWFIYPMILGIVGLLAIISMRFVYTFPESSNNTSKAKSCITIILVFIIVLFVSGRIVSFINTNYTHTGYWEKRFLGYIFLTAAMVAPIPMIGFYETIRRTLSEHVSRVLTVLFVSLIMILGFSSITIQIEYYSLAGKGSNTISNDELSAISFLQGKMAQEKDSFIVTPTKTSGAVLSIAGPKYPFSFYDLLSSSREPALPMYVIDAYNTKRTFLYLHDRDYNLLRSIPDNWLFSHLIPTLRPIYSNSDVSIYEIPPLSFPKPYSDTVLITPSDERSKRWMYAQDILALTAANYTVRSDNVEDSHLEKSKILSFDPKSAINLNESFSTKSNLVGYRQLSGNWTLLDDGLHAGSDAPNPVHKILSPIRHIKGDQMNMSASVLFNELDPMIPSYVRLIYSWKDPANYRYIEGAFFGNHLYLNSGFVEDGKVSAAGEWPGIQAFEFKARDVINISMSLNESAIRVTANETDLVFGTKSEPESGFVGFDSIHGKDLVFKNFYVSSQSAENKLSQYKDFVKNGGSLTVFNADGRGELYDFVKSLEANNRKVDKISPDSGSDIYSIKFGKGGIQYFDIVQIINDIENGRLTFSSLYDISKFLPVDRSLNNYSSLGQVKAIFDEVSANGSISATTNALILPRNIENIGIEFNNGSSIFINRFSDLDIRYHDIIDVYTRKMEIKEGTGLYTSMMLSPVEPLSVSFNDNANISLKADQKEVKLQNVSAISILSDEPISLLDPSFLIDGNATFKRVLSGQLRSQVGIEGQDLKVEGNSSFDVFMADSKILAESISIEGRKEVNPPVVPFNEFRPIDSPFSIAKIYSVPGLVRGLLVLPVIISILLMIVPLAKNRQPWIPE